MVSPSTKVGHFLAKVLGIELHDPDVRNTDEVTRGESVFSIQTTDTFVEQQPSTGEWFRELTPDKSEMLEYLHSLFPVVGWISHYNVKWLLGDLVAGMFHRIPSMAHRSVLIAFTPKQVSLLGPSLCLKAWHTLSWRICPLNTVCTRPSWA
jgi:hypothetical protein